MARVWNNTLPQDGYPSREAGARAGGRFDQPPDLRRIRNSAETGGKLRYMHDHSHAGPSSAKVLRYSLAATCLYVLVTLVAGLRGHSLALLSGPGPNAPCLPAFLLSSGAVFLQHLPPTRTND